MKIADSAVRLGEAHPISLSFPLLVEQCLGRSHLLSVMPVAITRQILLDNGNAALPLRTI